MAGKTRRILGIDPGSVRTGWAVVDSQGDRLIHVDSGFILAGQGDFPERLRKIFDGIQSVAATHAPTAMAIERVFVAHNPDSAIKLGQARGAAICGALQASLPVAEYSASEIKQAVVGSGRAGKEQVQHMVAMLLGIREALQADQADALAVAVCHAHTAASVLAGLGQDTTSPASGGRGGRGGRATRGSRRGRRRA